MTMRTHTTTTGTGRGRRRRRLLPAIWLPLGLLTLLTLLTLGGCGWEPLVPPEAASPSTPERPPEPALSVRIVPVCEVCGQGQDEGVLAAPPPLTVTFKAEVTAQGDAGDTQVLIYSWNFGDGTLGEGPKVTHTYTKPGTYYARLRVITASGLEARDEVKVVVQPPPKPEPQVQVDVSEGEVCALERQLPKAVAVGERFTVQVTIRAKRDLQIVTWQDNVWFPQFRLLQDPTGVWIGMEAGEARVLLYDVELWQAPAAADVWMSGTLKCNLGGNHESEVHTLKSTLNVLRVRDGN